MQNHPHEPSIPNATLPEPAAAAAAAAAPTAHPTAPHARRALAGLSLAMLLASLGTSIATVALPTLAGAFSASFQEVQWIVLAYLLASTMLLVTAGRLGDLVGRRRLLSCGLLLFTLASAVCGAAPTLWLLVAARAAQGLGAAIMLSLGMALVGETVGKDRLGSAMGLLGTMSAIGTVLGPSLGGALLAWFDWRAIFLVNVPLGLLGCVLVHRHLPADARERAPGRRFDGGGALLLAGTLGAYALAMTIGRGRFGLGNAGLLLAAVVGIAAFLRVERRVASPLIDLAAFRDARLSGGVVMSLLVATVMMATLVVGPFYLSGALGLDAARVGLVMSVGPLVAALAGVPAGRLVDRVGAPRMTQIGLGGMAAGAGLLALLPGSLGIGGYLVPIVVLTAHYALFQAANNTSVLANVPPLRRGVVSGLLNLSRNLGLITGTTFLGAVFLLGSGGGQGESLRPEQVAAGLRAVFALATGLLVLAFAVGMRGRRSSGEAPAARGEGTA